MSKRVSHAEDDLDRAGLIADYATLAQLARVSRARISQIMNLLVLAPDIQETLCQRSVCTGPGDTTFEFAFYVTGTLIGTSSFFFVAVTWIGMWVYIAGH